MLFIIGEILLFLAILYFCGILLVGRNPQKKGWYKTDLMMGNVHIFTIMVIMIAGISMIIKAAMTVDAVSEVFVPGVLLIVLVLTNVFIIKKMRIKEHLAAYDALRKSVEALRTIPISPPDKGTNGQPPMQKAA